MAYVTAITGMNEDEIERFDIEIGMTEDPADDAKAALKAHQEEMGIVFENPDEPVLGTDQEVLGG